MPSRNVDANFEGHQPRRRKATVVEGSVAQTPISDTKLREIKEGIVALDARANMLNAMIKGGMSGITQQTDLMTSGNTNYPGDGGNAHPALMKINDEKPPIGTMLGVPGVPIYSGIINDPAEYNRDFYWRDAIDQYDQMYRSDAQSHQVVQVMGRPIRRAKWDIEAVSEAPIDQEIASFVRSALFDDMVMTTSDGEEIIQTWDDILRHILTMIPYGFSALEYVWRRDKDGWTKWGCWAPMAARTIWRWWTGGQGELLGIQQYAYKDGMFQLIEIPAKKIIRFTFDQQANNYDGVSALRAAYPHWFYKTQMYAIQALGLERTAVPVPVVHLPAGASEQDYAKARIIGENLRANERMHVTLPEGWMIEYLQGSMNESALDAAIEHHDRMIARAVGAMFLNLGGQRGAMNLDKSQTATFNQAIQAEADYIAERITASAIRKLVRANYDGVKVYPKLKVSKISAQDIEGLATMLQGLAGFVNPDPTLEDWLRDEAGLPKAAPVQDPYQVQGDNPSAGDSGGSPDDQQGANKSSDNGPQDQPPGGGDQGDQGDSGDQGGDTTSATEAEDRLSWLLSEAGDAVEMAVDHYLSQSDAESDTIKLGFGGFHIEEPGSARGGAGGLGDAFNALHPRGGGGKFRFKPEAHEASIHEHLAAHRSEEGAGSGGRREETGAKSATKARTTKTENAGARRVASAKATPKSDAAPERIRNIPVGKIHVGLNPREHFDPQSINELAASIKEHGLLQPITVRPHENGYQIIAGERRFRAMQQNGETHIPAIVKRVGDQEARELAIIENVNRADMRPMETARAYRGLADGGMTTKQIAARLGKSEAHVQQHLDMLNLHPHVAQAVDEGRLHLGVVRDIAKLSQAGQQEVTEKILANDLGVKAGKALAKAYYAREHQGSLFASKRDLSKAESDAKARYDEAITKITAHLSRLDDETMSDMAHAVDSPAREQDRLKIMATQLAKMQRLLQNEQAARDVSGIAASEWSDFRAYTLSLIAEATIALTDDDDSVKLGWGGFHIEEPGAARGGMGGLGHDTNHTLYTQHGHLFAGRAKGGEEKSTASERSAKTTRPLDHEAQARQVERAAKTAVRETRNVGAARRGIKMPGEHETVRVPVKTPEAPTAPKAGKPKAGTKAAAKPKAIKPLNDLPMGVKDYRSLTLPQIKYHYGQAQIKPVLEKMALAKLQKFGRDAVVREQRAHDEGVRTNRAAKKYYPNAEDIFIPPVVKSALARRLTAKYTRETKAKLVTALVTYARLHLTSDLYPIFGAEEDGDSVKLGFGFGGFHITEPGGSRATGGIGGGNDRAIYSKGHRFDGSRPGEHKANIHEHLAAQHHGEGEGGGGRSRERTTERTAKATKSPNAEATRRVSGKAKAAAAPRASAKKPAQANGERDPKAMHIARVDSQLRQLNKPTDAHEALAKLAGGDPAKLFQILRDEPTGVTEVMAREAGIYGLRPAGRTNAGADRVARAIAEHLGMAKATPAKAAAPKAAKQPAAPKESAAVRNAREIATLHEASAKWQADPANHAAREVQPGETLVALRHTGKDIDPYGPPNIHDLAFAYGEHGVARALNDYTLPRLQMAAAEHGISAKSKAAIIPRLTAAATHGHYSANFPKASATPRGEPKSAKAPAARATKALTAGEQAPRISVRSHVHNGQDGFLIHGTDRRGRKISIFSRSKGEAEHIRNQVKNGEEVTFFQ